MLKGFRDFIMRGNVIDLAVAVAIGTAFTALVNAFATALINPIIDRLLNGGIKGGGLEILGINFDPALLLNAAITFLITAAVVYFVFVLPMQKFSERMDKGEDAGAELAPDEEQVQLLKEIRDSLANGNGGAKADSTPADA